jgi:hypothetical protein
MILFILGTVPYILQYTQKKETAIKKATCADYLHHSAETFSIFFSLNPLHLIELEWFYINFIIKMHN